MNQFSLIIPNGGVKLAQVLIIGGGTAGIAAALNLAERGIFSTIVEKSPTIGGRASDLCCKGIIECVRCDVCLSTDKIIEVVQSDFIRVFTNTEIARVTGKPGAFRVTLSKKDKYVRESACVACDACAEVCPVEGSAIKISPRSGVPRTYQIDEERCIRVGGGDCGKCVEVCPTKAIDFLPRQSRIRLVVGAMIIATGYEPFDPSREPRYGYGVCKDVVSSIEVENCIHRFGKLVVPSTGAIPKRIAIIQCVGSRDDRLGISYCSKVCCKYALKVGQLLKLQNPSGEISFFFMDWRPYDLIDDELADWAQREKNVNLIRSRPAEVLNSESGKPTLRFASADDEMVREEEFDLIMLSVGILPPKDISILTKKLNVVTSNQGFIAEVNSSPDVTISKGIFAAGCCTGPKDIEESVIDGVAASGKVVSFLEGLE